MKIKQRIFIALICLFPINSYAISVSDNETTEQCKALHCYTKTESIESEYFFTSTIKVNGFKLIELYENKNKQKAKCMDRLSWNKNYSDAENGIGDFSVLNGWLFKNNTPINKCGGIKNKSDSYFVLLPFVKILTKELSGILIDYNSHTVCEWIIIECSDCEETTPVPEPTSLLLFGSGILFTLRNANNRK